MKRCHIRGTDRRHLHDDRRRPRRRGSSDTGSFRQGMSFGTRRPRSSTRTPCGAATDGWPRGDRSSSTRAASPAARRRTSSSCASPARRRGSGGATSTSRSTRRASTVCGRRSSTTSPRQQRLYVIDAFAGADPAHRIGVRVVTASPYHALFAKTMFIRPADEELDAHEPQALVLHAPEVEADPEADGDAHRHVRRPAPVADRGRDRRHVLRRRDQEIDLHRHERPAAARGRLPDALLGERRAGRRRRGVLRPLGHRQDHALGRSRPAA